MGKQTWRINMDEASACMRQGDGKGIFFASGGRHGDCLVRKASRGRQWASFIHAALMRDRPGARDT